MTKKKNGKKEKTIKHGFHTKNADINILEFFPFSLFYYV